MDALKRNPVQILKNDLNVILLDPFGDLSDSFFPPYFLVSLVCACVRMRERGAIVCSAGPTVKLIRSFLAPFIPQ